MSEPSDLILTIGLTAAERRQVEQAVPSEKRIAHVESLDEALQRPPSSGREGVAVASSTERARAEQTLAADGLPRWPVVEFTPADLGARLIEARGQHAVRRDAARARGDLLTMARRISHEMRSPLGCILTSADVLREELADGVVVAAPLLEPIVESANELLTLIDRISLVARATAAPPPSTEVDVGMAVWAAREYLASRITRAGAEVSEPDAWPTVRGVREWIERIWFNLLANAVQHAGPQARIELGAEPDHGHIRFFVRDHGPGVLPEIRDSLFRPFHRLHESDSGRGLGLAIVQRLVELQGGFCGYEPLSDGSRFYFSLPASVAG